MLHIKMKRRNVSENHKISKKKIYKSNKSLNGVRTEDIIS